MILKVGEIMIITVAPCPAVEYLYEVDILNKNKDMEATSTRINILSKGIHSAEVIKILQDEAMVLSLLGGFAGRYIKHHMDKSKLKSDIVWCDSETPHKMCIAASNKLDYYGVTRHNKALTEKDLTRLGQKLKNYYKNVSTMVIAGYLPQQFDSAFYSNIIKESKACNIKTVLSTGQKSVLENALKESPYTLMFTKEQLKSLEINSSSREQIIRAMQGYLNQGIHYVALHLKEEGIYLISKSKICYVETMATMPKEWTNASSGAFLGALAIGINRKYEQEKIAKLAAATACVAKHSENMPLCSKKDIDLLTKKVKVREISL